MSAELTKPGEQNKILSELVAKEYAVGAARAQSYITQMEEESQLTAQTALDHGSCEAIISPPAMPQPGEAHEEQLRANARDAIS